MNQVARKEEQQIQKSETRRSIYALEQCLLDLPEKDKIDPDSCVTHFFAPGVYVRQFFLPKGMIVTGKIHKTKHISIISFGKVSVTTEGRGIEIIEGPYTFTNEPGDKRAVYAHEDTLWTTIHPTNETDLEKIEDEVIAKTYAELEGPDQNLRIEGEYI